MSRPEDTIAHGNRGHVGNSDSRVTCADGFHLSVIAGGGTYCSPRPALCGTPHGRHTEYRFPFTSDAPCTYPGPFTEVEVGYPSERPEPWDQWQPLCEDPREPTDTVYGFVPVTLVRALIAAHGGETS
jgi:hypothetical protein